MLLLQNQTNQVYLTLSEAVSVTATPVYFLFRFVDYATNEEILFTTPDITTNITRCNQFEITLTGSSAWQNLTRGTIHMAPNGDWRYFCYAQYSSGNTSMSGALPTILEQGLIKLSGTPVTYITQTYTGSSQTYGYYQG
tara:strand:- start:1300 stop:1716 length:417 start_codon:yes stop_codon:yes gene_type:complete